MKKVLILGALGYVGSRLRQVLSVDHQVTANDICWFQYEQDILDHDYARLTTEDLSKYDVVVVLAGHSSVKTCDGPIPGPWLNNVTNFTNLLNRLRNDQLVIYASSASVYGNSDPGTKHSENNINFVPVNHYDVTKYALDQQAIIANLSGKRVIGLRFGTVNGCSPNIRCDVMINAMYHSYKVGSPITITNKHISRAILGIEDLCSAVQRCIERPSLGIYNLASFNSTVEEIARGVAAKTGATIVDKGKQGHAYDFAIDTTLFERTYDFKFTETVSTIVDSLIEGYENSRLHFRDNYIIYQWEKPNAILTHRKRQTT